MFRTPPEEPGDRFIRVHAPQWQRSVTNKATDGYAYTMLVPIEIYRDHIAMEDEDRDDLDVSVDEALSEDADAAYLTITGFTVHRQAVMQNPRDDDTVEVQFFGDEGSARLLDVSPMQLEMLLT